MGCGKSSVGRRLSELLCCRFMDLDDVIVEREGRSIPEIFASDGEKVFREMEKTALCSVISQHSPTPQETHPYKDVLILSLGGGTVMTQECAQLVQENSVCVYLRASADTLVRNLQDAAEGRPMLAGDKDLRTRIEELTALRTATYEDTAHVIIDTDGRQIDSIAEEILSKL